MRLVGRIVCLALALCLCTALIGCEEAGEPPMAASSQKPFDPGTAGSAYPQLLSPTTGSQIATVSTPLGDISFLLFPEEAPMAVENFTGLAARGYYDGLPFHRVEPDFLIQTGASAAETGDETVWGTKPFPIELSADMHHFRGAVAMAADENGGNKSQFYIVAAPDDSVTENAAKALTEAGMDTDAAEAYFLTGGLPELDGTDTVFGQVYEGYDVLAAIAQSKDPVTVTSVTISEFLFTPTE